MNKNYLVFLAILVFLSSCASHKAIDKTTLEGQAETDEFSIVFKSGRKVIGKELTAYKLALVPRSIQRKAKKTGCFYDYEWIALDGIKYHRDSVCSYQEGRSNYLYHDCVRTKRIRSGKLNLYYFNGIPEVDETRGSRLSYYVFAKSTNICDSKLIDKKLNEFYAAISDNPGAAKLCKELFPDLRRSQTDASLVKLLKVVDKYNE